VTTLSVEVTKGYINIVKLPIFLISRAKYSYFVIFCCWSCRSNVHALEPTLTLS